MMARQRKPRRTRFTVYCLDSEWERIREIADRRGVSINDHVISAGLTVEPRPKPPAARPLSDEERRRLLERVDRLADAMLADAGEDGSAIAQLRKSVSLLLSATLRDLDLQGRGDEIRPLLIETFGMREGPELDRRFRAWIERDRSAG